MKNTKKFLLITLLIHTLKVFLVFSTTQTFHFPVDHLAGHMLAVMTIMTRVSVIGIVPLKDSYNSPILSIVTTQPNLSWSDNVIGLSSKHPTTHNF